uniref:Transposase n=1 Tax=Macrostomum lignano TaxID=282301 RepID=A0A1I8F3Z6_9PLAT
RIGSVNFRYSRNRGSRGPGPSAEDGLVDQLATSGAPNSAAEFRNMTRPEPAGSRASDRQYLTDTDYVVPQCVQDDESAGAIFCAPLRARLKNDPGGRQPIVFGSQGSAFSGVSAAARFAGDTKLAVHARRSPTISDRSRNIASAFKPKPRRLEVSNPIFAGPDSDEE